jgi:type III pantothenate kinase
MLLAIDIGNTQTIFGIFRGKKLIAARRVFTSSLRTEKNIYSCVRSVLRDAGIKTGETFGAVIASVVPRQTRRTLRVLKLRCNIRSMTISGATNSGLKLRYKNPSALGADRLCNAVAAFHMFGGPVIVADFGTATKYEAISRRGEYLGGAIGLGVGSAADGLYTRTAKLPRIKLQFPHRGIGTNTVTAIQSGVLYGALDALEGMVKRFKAITGSRTKVICTGGFSHLVAAHSHIVDHTAPYLVLEGARIIYERAHPGEN